MQAPHKTSDTSQSAIGTVHAVRGAVVDVVYASNSMPPINAALHVEWDVPTPLILEVHSHLDLTTLRAVAFQSTAGLARGVAVRASGGPVAGRSLCRLVTQCLADCLMS
jgi:F-type H+-transporting ATPase subunit beta